MKLRFITLLVLVLAVVANADVTARYDQKIDNAAPMPGGQSGPKMPLSIVTRIKGTKGCTNAGDFGLVVDSATEQITEIDNAGKRYAVGTMQQFIDAMTSSVPKMPEQAQAIFEQVKSSFQSRKTGRTDTILGIKAEETEGVLTMEGPGGMSMKMSQHVWTATQPEVLRVPALRELVGQRLLYSRIVNPAAMVSQIMGKTFDGMKSMMEEVQKSGATMLKTQTEVYMQPNPTGSDGAFMTTTLELVELSGAPVDEAIFKVPEGYKQAPLDEMVKGIMSAMMSK